MKKTTKKSDKVQYGRTSKASHDKFFNGAKKKPEKQKERAITKDSSEDESSESFEAPEVELIDDGGIGLYRPVNTIDTCVGPIGEFLVIPDLFPLHPSIAAFGKRRTGKSYSFRWWLYRCFRHIPFGCVFTDTKINDFWDHYVPPHLVFDGLKHYQLQALIDRQKEMIAEWKHDHPKEQAADPDAYKKAPELAAFVILDDVIAHTSMMIYENTIKELFVQGRHLCLSVFITTQHVKGIGPMLRGKLHKIIQRKSGRQDELTLTP